MINMKKIYIILSHSGSFPSFIIKNFTRCKYSHVAISLDKSIDKMYTFGRKKVNNPFVGGFIIESTKSEFYQKFKKTKCLIYALNISNDSYVKLEKILCAFEKNSSKYRYDIIGLLFKGINVKVVRKNYYVCTDFLSYILKECDIYTFKKKVLRPKDFVDIPNQEFIYKGLLLQYKC